MGSDYQRIFESIVSDSQRMQREAWQLDKSIRQEFENLHEHIQLTISDLAFHYSSKRKDEPSKKSANIMDPEHEPSEKSKLLTELKESVPNVRRFKKGTHLMLRTKLLDRTGRYEKIFVVRQIVWSIDEMVIKGIVVKQITGTNSNQCTLTRYDCEKLHVKYEPGLQIMSMELPWIVVNNNKLESLKAQQKNGK